MYRTIVCATDFSDRSRVALAHARQLAQETGAALHVVHCVEPAPVTAHLGVASVPGTPQARAPIMKEHLDELLRDNPVGDRQATGHLEVGRAPDAICAVAERLSADVLVLGTHGRSGLKRMVLGSTTEQVLRHSRVPVLAIPPKDA